MHDFIPIAKPIIGDEEIAAVGDVMRSGMLTQGKIVEEFEEAFSKYLNVKHSIAVSNGTIALDLALKGYDLQPGDEIISPAFTFIATANCALYQGLKPVFADVDPKTFNIDPNSLAEKITGKTRAVVGVHLYGQPFDLKAVQQICRDKNLILIEDCAQAHGARYNQQPVGSFGLAAAWSFYPTKNLGALGDGGLITTNSPEIAERLRLLREYGWSERYHSHQHGWNSRLDELQAALLRVKLRHLEADNARRRAIARQYRAAWAGLLTGPVGQEGVGVEHLFVVRHPRRAELSALLNEAGIGTAVHYPVPCHLQEAYRPYGRGAGSLPVTERAAQEILSLPLYPELTEAEIAQILAAGQAAARRLAV